MTAPFTVIVVGHPHESRAFPDTIGARHYADRRFDFHQEQAIVTVFDARNPSGPPVYRREAQ